MVVSIKTPNNAAKPQILIRHIVQVVDHHNEYNQALWCHSIAWYFSRGRHQNLKRPRLVIILNTTVVNRNTVVSKYM